MKFHKTLLSLIKKLYLLNHASNFINFYKINLFVGLNGGCDSDNLTIQKFTWREEPPEIYCGTEIPKVIHVEGIINITFRTDKYIQKRGFIMHYEIEGIPISFQ